MPASYDIRIDWDAGEPDYVSNGTFETTSSPWQVGGTIQPTIARSTTRAYVGDASLLITWPTATTADLPLASIQMAGLTVGSQYTAQAWVWVPTGSPDVHLVIGGVTIGTASTLQDQWQQVTVTWTAATATDSVQVWPETDVTSGQQVWVDEVHAHAGNAVLQEDVTTRTLERTTLQIDYGRDQARSLSPVRPGEATFELLNTSRDYSPENTTSPIAGYLGPGRPLTVRAHHSGTNYVLYRGFLDEYNLLPGRSTRSVEFTAQDALAQLGEVTISTALYQGLRTGDAIHRILDAAGWPTADRDIDPGGTTIRWWWEEGTDAYTALTRVVNSEGPDAFALIGSDGELVFRDRHHRLIRSASTSVQATFRDTGTEPVFSEPFEYDIGWRDLINAVQLSVTESDPGALATVWQEERFFNIAPGQTRTIDVVFDNPVWAVQSPTQGAITTDPDIVNPTGNTIQVDLSRTSGKSLQLRLSVAASGSTAEVHRIRLRGYPLETAREVKVTAEDSTSIARNGRREYTGSDAPWLSRNDAAAIADIILAKRATRLPIIQMRIVGGSDTQLTQQLARDLSDRVRVIEPQLGLDGEFFVEQIQHRISQAGKYHETTFGCEKVPSQPSNLFTFDVSGKGFNDGRFAQGGLDNSSSVFIFDHATQGQFDVGLFGN